MKKLNSLCMLTLLCSFPLSLTSCTNTSGNKFLTKETSFSIDSKIKDGVTSKSEVSSMFGGPIRTQFTDSGHEQWFYIFNKESQDGENFVPLSFHRGMHGERTQLTIIFNDNQKVWHHSYTVSEIHHKLGAVNDEFGFGSDGS